MSRHPIEPVISVPKTVRIAVVGDSGVGKTSLLEKFLCLNTSISKNDRYPPPSSTTSTQGTDPFNNKNTQSQLPAPSPTLGVDYLKKKVALK